MLGVQAGRMLDLDDSPILAMVAAGDMEGGAGREGTS